MNFRHPLSVRSVAFIVAVFIGAGLLSLFCPAVAAQPSSDARTAGRIDVQDVDPAMLLFAMAEAANVNLVAAIPANRGRVSLSTQFTSITDLLVKVAAKLDMRGASRNGRILVMSPCLAPDAQSGGAYAPGRLAFRLHDVPLADLLATASADVPASLGHEPQVLHRRLAVRLGRVTQQELMRASALAVGHPSGLNLDAGNPGNPGLAACDAIEIGPRTALNERELRLQLRTNHCPYRPVDEQRRQCGPLEYFDLRRTMPRGFIESMGRRLAFVEAPDAVLHIVEPGSYMGRAHGRVLDVLRDGIELSELERDDEGEWRLSRRTIRYGVQPMATRVDPLDHLSPDSPQAEYNKAVRQLVTLKRSVELIAERCVAQHPRTRRTVEDALSRWRARHEKALQEVVHHGDALIDSVASDHDVAVGIAEGVVRDVIDGDALKGLGDVFQPLASRAEAFCAGFPSRLLGKGHDLSAGLPAQWRLLDGCHAASTCPTLNPAVPVKGLRTPAIASSSRAPVGLLHGLNSAPPEYVPPAQQ